MSNISSVSYLRLFCVSNGVMRTVEYRGVHRGGKGGGGTHTDRFERIQKIDGRQRA